MSARSTARQRQARRPHDATNLGHRSDGTLGVILFGAGNAGKDLLVGGTRVQKAGPKGRSTAETHSVCQRQIAGNAAPSCSLDALDVRSPRWTCVREERCRRRSAQASSHGRRSAQGRCPGRRCAHFAQEARVGAQGQSHVAQLTPLFRVFSLERVLQKEGGGRDASISELPKPMHLVSLA